MALALAYWIDGTTNLSQHSLNTLCFTDWGLTSILWIAAFSFSFLEILLLSARFNERLSRHWRDKLVDHTDHLLEAKEDKAVHFTQDGVGIGIAGRNYGHSQISNIKKYSQKFAEICRKVRDV